MSMPEIDNGRVTFTTHTALIKIKAKAGGLRPILEDKFPGIQWNGAKKVWWLPANSDNVAKVNRVFNTALKPVDGVIKSQISMFPFKTKPRGHQFAALEACGSREAFAYFMDPGLGKTKVAIDDMMILNHGGKVTDVIITCSKSITGTWLREIATHGHYEQWEIYRWNNDGSKPFVEGIHNPAEGEVTMRWFIINIDAIQDGTQGWRAAQAFVTRSINCAMIIDESTIIKNIEAKRTTQAHILGGWCKYRRILTGTPIANTPLDFYAQLVFLDESIFHGWSFYAYKSHYAITGGYKQREIYGYTNQDELAAIVGAHSFRATKADCLDLPPRVFETREITLSKKTWKVYDQIVNETMLSLSEEKVLTADMVTKKIIKLRQLMGGWVLEDKDPDQPNKPRTAYPLCTEKLEDFKDLMCECRGSKVIVWCQFVHEIHYLKDVLEAMKFNVVKYHGTMKSKERDAAEREFEHGKAEVILVQNDTGSMGLTLNAASVAIAYSNPVYLLNRSQLTERNYRDGQTKSTTFFDLVCVGTIDQSNYETLIDKMDLSEAIMKASAGHKVSMDAIKGILYPKRTAGGWKGDKRDA